MLFGTVVLASVVGLTSVSQNGTKNDFTQDFDYAWRQIAASYAYWDAKATAWPDIPRLYRADLERVTTKNEFVHLLESVVEELYDPHLQLTVNTATSPRLIPSGADIWAEWRDGLAVVTEVRRGSDAEAAGVQPGAIVLAFDHTAISAAVDARLGRCYPHSVAAARDWALRAVLAGRHNERRLLRVRDGGTEREIDLPAPDQFTTDSAPVTHSQLEGGVGYVRFNNSLGNDATVAAFDRALDDLPRKGALIIDLRNTPGGGNSTVARGILGRFVTREMPYQKHVLPSEERTTGIRRSWLELVSPRGATAYAQPVAVLVDHWTGSMGEGLAIGFDGTHTGTVIGTPMAGLAGSTERVTLPRTGIGINLPTERLYHVDGTRREAFRPTILVDVARPAAGRDPFVMAALRSLGVSSQDVVDVPTH